MSDRRDGAAAAMQGAGAEAAKVPPMFTDAQLRRLKWAVVAMGVVLILGFGVVIFRIMYLLQRPAAPSAATQAPGATARVAPRPDVALDLPEGAIVRSVTAGGDRLVIHYDAPSGGGIAVVDLATGATQRVRLRAGAAGR